MASWIARIVRIALLALLPMVLLGAAPGKKPVIGQPAPPAELTLLDGTKISLDQLRGEVVVLNFWATWWGPCRTEMPLLDTYYRIQKRAGLRVFAIATEDSVPISKLRPFLDKLAIDSARRIKGPYGPIERAVPTSFIIDRAGTLRYAKASALDLDDLNRELVPLLREPRPTLP